MSRFLVMLHVVCRTVIEGDRSLDFREMKTSACNLIPPFRSLFLLHILILVDFFLENIPFSSS